jgi:hypothetical protein
MSGQSGQFVEAEVIARFDRSYGDKNEELRLERGEYQGKPTYSLRLYWQAQDGTWRWAAQKPTQSGKCWERLNLKQRELHSLGEALIAEAKAQLGYSGGAPPQQQRRSSRPVEPTDPESVYRGPGHGDEIPF